MQDQLTITKANALMAYKEGDAAFKKSIAKLFPEVDFNPDIKDQVKSYEDACVLENIYPLTLSAFDFLPEADRVAFYSLHQLTVICKALNQGWVPDWSNLGEYKYYPWFEWVGSGFSYSADVSGHSSTCVGSRLVFKSRELAIYAGKQFSEQYNQFLKIS